jgi:hypothetical protein
MQNDLLDFFKESYLQWIGLGIAISLLIWGALRIRAHFRDESDASGDNHLLLKQFRELQLQGELSEEEFRKLKSRVVVEDESSQDVRPQVEGQTKSET